MQGQAEGKFNLECLSKIMEMQYSWDRQKQFALLPTGTRAEKFNFDRVIIKKNQQSKYVIIHLKGFFIKTPTITARLYRCQYCRERWRVCFRKEVQQTLSPWTQSWLSPTWKTLIWVCSVKLVHYNHKKPTLGESWCYDTPWRPTKKLSECFTPLKSETVSAVKREKIKFECGLSF